MPKRVQPDAKKLVAASRAIVPDGVENIRVAAWVVVANVILNLDEVFMKP